MVKTILTILILSISISLSAKMEIDNISPANWWVGMENNKVLLLITGQELAGAAVKLNRDDVTLLKIIPSANANYLLIELEISKKASPGILEISFLAKGKIQASANFQLLPNKTVACKPLTNIDVIYQIVPDRFKDGEPENNTFNGALERYDRKNPAGIHGGDLTGISESMGYFKTLGITALDLCPILASNQLFNSYEHNGITSLYHVDPRLGTNANLVELTTLARENEIKTVLTFIFNQLGKQHFLVKKNPFPAWIVPDFKSYSSQSIDATFTDPYASQSDLLSKFTSWPDMDIAALNQADPDLRRYLIQHCIWWLKTTGADAIRIEKTYLNSAELLTELMIALNKDFPKLSVITDYESAPAVQSNYLSQKLRQSNIKVCPSDYPLSRSLADAFSSFVDYNTGINQVYKCIAEDYIYENPSSNITFIDNSKTSRAFSNADKEINQLKMMLGVLFTIRGIPQILYGTEMLLAGNVDDGFGFVRSDMPGISPNDMPNAFTRKGVTTQQIEITKYLARLIELRKTKLALNSGDFKHYIPDDGLYVYFRKTESSMVMVLVNNHPKLEKRFEPERYQSDLGNLSKATELITKQDYIELKNIIIGSKSIMIFELR